MTNILADILDKIQHFSTLTQMPEKYCPSNCPHCYKHGLWKHGVYHRRAQCENQNEPIPIPRFLCADCGHTCSTLPEYIPPRRWYYWVTQQAVLLLLMLGESVEKVCNKLSSQWAVVPSIDTIYRWQRRLRDQFSIHQFHLCSRHPQLRFPPTYDQFWAMYFDEEGGLSYAMLTLNRIGQSVP